MSFAATLAIVSLYESVGRRLHHAGASWWRRVWYHVLGIVVTSLAATLATAPFVLYHFNRFALFGLISNMIVVPLATFVIMPGMVLALLLMPFGWQAIGYVPLAFGTDIMIKMAQWVTSLPYASLHLPSPTDAGLIVASFGLLFLCLVKQRIRLAGIPVIAAGLATLMLHVPVDVFVSDDAHQVMVRLPDGRYTTLRGTDRSFTVQNWLRTEGEDELVKLKETDIECDKVACEYELNKRSLILVKKPSEEALKTACARKVDILITWWYLHEDECPGPHELIGRNELERYGEHALWLRPDGVRIARTRGEQGRRIWQPVLTQEMDDEEW
jgi:competence protein ComEC